MAFRIIFLYTILITLISCKGNKSTDENIKRSNIEVIKEIYPNGKIKAEQEFIKYSKDSFIADGFEKEYYENGNVKAFTFFRQNVLDSTFLRYYPNGILSDSMYRRYGKLWGFQYGYYSNGKPKIFAINYDDSIKMFLTKYDSIGNIASMEGHLISATLDDKKTNKVLLGETKKIVNIPVLLPNTTAQLQIKLKDNNNKIIVDTFINIFQKRINTFAYPYNFTFNNLGEYKYEAKETLTDNTTGKVIKAESTQYVIDVVKE